MSEHLRYRIPEQIEQNRQQRQCHIDRVPARQSGQEITGRRVSDCSQQPDRMHETIRMILQLTNLIRWLAF